MITSLQLLSPTLNKIYKICKINSKIKKSYSIIYPITSTKNFNNINNSAKNIMIFVNNIKNKISNSYNLNIKLQNIRISLIKFNKKSTK